ncbi:helix-turn-helix domain-containing protein [Piscinibacter sp.]|uniref:helix-turn-helix domain-containing protein n=1 Tax=Piscinibacter sp. TaxID=1903157 RepID=UPI00391F1A04
MEIGSIQDLGSAVRAARLSHKLTQEQAAALCGVSMPFLNQLEGGKRQHLSISKVLGVCGGLGLSLRAFGPGVPVDQVDRSPAGDA